MSHGGNEASTSSRMYNIIYIVYLFEAVMDTGRVWSIYIMET